MSMTTIHLHGPLGEMFGTTHRRDVSSMGEAIRCLSRTHPRKGDTPGFLDMIRMPGASYSLLAAGTALRVQDIHMETQGLELHIVPVVEGNKDEMTQVIIGIIVAVAAFYFTGPAGSGAAWEGVMASQVGSAVASFGIAMAVGGIAQMLAASPQGPKTGNQGDKKASAIYDGAVNTIGQNNPVQILYGKMEIGSAVVATMISNTDADYGTMGEYGLDATGLISLLAGGTAPFDTADDVLAYDSDGVVGAARVYSVNKGFGAVIPVTTSAGSLNIAESDTVVLVDQSTKRAADLMAGDTLYGGVTVSTVGTRQARINLKSLTLLTNQTAHEPGQGETWRPYYDGPEWRVYFVNGIPVEPSIYQPQLHDADGNQS